MSSIQGKVDAESFGDEFIEKYLHHGFSNLPKKEIDLLVLRLLLQHVDGWSAENPDTFEMSKALGVKRGKLRSMLDELAFRDAADEDKMRERLKIVLEKYEKDVDSSKVRLQIENGYLREFAKSLVEKDFGIVDTSFNSSIISVSGEKFLALVLEVSDEALQKKISEQIKKAKILKKAEADGPLWRTLLRELAKGAASETGKLSIKAVAAVIKANLLPLDVISGYGDILEGTTLPAARDDIGVA